jgi:hypothetical protein
LFSGDTPPAFDLYIKQGKSRMIHRGSCGFCNEGADRKADRSQCGRWSDAFASLEAAEAAWAKLGGSKPRHCGRVS